MNTLIAFLQRLGFSFSAAANTVEDAMADFYKAKDKLVAAVAENDKLIAAAKAAKEAADKAEAAAEERLARCIAVKDKLEDLLGL
jgi:primosomal protein N''